MSEGTGRNMSAPVILRRLVVKNNMDTKLFLRGIKRIIALTVILGFGNLWAVSLNGNGLYNSVLIKNDYSLWNRYSSVEIHPAVTHWQDRKQIEPVRSGSYSETPARRAEIVFLISLPFSLLLNIGATALVYQAATGNTNLPSSVWAFAGTSALLFSGAIAWHDHLTVFPENNSSRERRMEFRYSAPFTR